MKKVLCTILAVVMCFCFATTAMASEADFVPSISYKDAPTILNAEMGGEDMGYCVIISSVLDAKNKTTDISQAARDELLSVYGKLDAGTMTLPLDGEYTILHLVDISWAELGCVQNGHPHKEELAKPDVTIDVTLDLDLGALANLKVFHYDENQWKAVKFVINDNGSVTLTMEDFCPVAFAIEGYQGDQPATGDTMGMEMGLWIGLMTVSAAAVVVLLINRRKCVK